MKCPKFKNLCQPDNEKWWFLYTGFWSVGPRRPSDQSDAIVAGWLAGWLSIYICMSLRGVPTSFPECPSRPLWGRLFKKANHFTMTTLNIRSDPMATWECAKQVQASSELLSKRNACALHFRELKKTRIDRDDVCMSTNVRKPPLLVSCQSSALRWLLAHGTNKYICSLLKVWCRKVLSWNYFTR